MLRLGLHLVTPALLCTAIVVRPTLAQQPAQPPVVAQAQTDAPAVQERRLTLWTGRVQSDNITRAEFGSADGHYDSVGLLLGLGRTSPRLDASIASDLEYRTYSVDTVEDETVGTLEASADVDIVPDRFSWLFTDEYGQGSMDPFFAERPGNRESLNVATTGPRLTLPFAGRTSLNMSADYSVRRYDEAVTANSDSTEYELGLFRQTRRTVQVGIVAATNEIEYTELTAPSPQIDRLSLRYIKTLPSGTMTAEVGRNEVTAGTLVNEEPLFDFAWNRTIGSRSQVNVIAARRFTDSGGLLTTDDALLVGSVILSAPNPLEAKRVTAQYLLTGERTSFSVLLGTAQFRYVGDTTLDNDSNEAQIDYTRTVSQRLMFGASYELVDRDFQENASTAPHDKDSTLSAWVNRGLGRHFAVGLAIAKYTRGGIQSFDERRYEVRLAYSPIQNAVDMGTLGR